MNTDIETVHEGKKPHQCGIYNMRFSHKQYIKGHVLRIREGKNPNKGKSPQQCEICHNTFIEKRTLKNHILEVHKGI